MSEMDYVHGYSEREKVRLYDQANTLDELLHGDTRYPAGSRVLEAGCGTGAQTVILAGNNPDTLFTSVDISPESIAHARLLVESADLSNVEFRQADIFNLPFENESFDHVFLCFVLEHLPFPIDALERLTSVLKPGGTMTVTVRLIFIREATRRPKPSSARWKFRPGWAATRSSAGSYIRLFDP